MILDAHLHIQIEDDFKNKPVDVLMFVNAATFDDWSQLEVFAKNKKNIVPFFGLHPCFISDANKSWRASLELYLNSNFSGVGEIGLDRAKGDLPFLRQTDFFESQLDIAVCLNRPVSVHCVKAWDAFLNIIKKRSVSLMVHGFAGSPELAKRLCCEGVYVSVSPRTLLHPEKSHFCLNSIDLKQLLIETDFPYIPNIGIFKNLSKYEDILELMYVEVSRLLSINIDILKEIVLSNGKVFANRIINR